MNDQPPLHRLFNHYSELPYSLRVLFTATLLILGMGYLFALLNIYFTYAGRAGGNPLMLSYEDIVVAYSGSGKGAILEGALQGPMATMLPPDERATVLTWVREGGARPAYDTNVKPILDKRCMTCHDGSNPHLPNLSDYDNLKKVTALDTGASIATLVRDSHIHLFGMTFIFFIVGTDVQPRLCASRLVQVYRHCGAVPGDRDGRQFLVLHQALPSVRMGTDLGRRLDGHILRHHVAGDDVPDVVLQAAGGHPPANGRRHSHRW